MNRTKRFISLLLSFALVFVNAITAYATDVESTQSTALIDVENVEITSGAVYDLSANASAAEVLSLTEGTVYVEFESTSTQQHQSLFSVSNPTTDEGSMYRHLHIYITPSGTLGMELRNTDEEFKYTLSSDNVLTSGVNRIAFKADAAGKTYKFFANGQLVGELSKEDYKFISDICEIVI